MALRITEHFTIEEFACHDGSPYPTAWIEDRLRPLCNVLERLRAAYGAPLTIVSGYRTPGHNLAVGGAGASQHMQGRAADVRPAGHVDAEAIERVHDLALELFAAGELPALGGLGLYTSPRTLWIHCDVRQRVPPDHLARWQGQNTGDEK